MRLWHNYRRELHLMLVLAVLALGWLGTWYLNAKHNRHSVGFVQSQTQVHHP